MSNQLLLTAVNNNIFENVQSGFCKHHSTDTALLRVTTDLSMAADGGMCSVLLDRSTAFHTVDCSILLDRMKHWVGISGTALNGSLHTCETGGSVTTLIMIICSCQIWCPSAVSAGTSFLCSVHASRGTYYP